MWRNAQGEFTPKKGVRIISNFGLLATDQQNQLVFVHTDECVLIMYTLSGVYSRIFTTTAVNMISLYKQKSQQTYWKEETDKIIYGLQLTLTKTNHSCRVVV